MLTILSFNNVKHILRDTLCNLGIGVVQLERLSIEQLSLLAETNQQADVTRGIGKAEE